MDIRKTIDIQRGPETFPVDEELTHKIGESAVTMEERVLSKVAVVTDLGENNVGNLGPDNETERQASAVLVAELPEYSKPASNCWICVDGRCSDEEIAAAEAGESKEANPQIGGSPTVSGTAAHFMADPNTHQPLSITVPAVTAAAIADGLRIKVHGANGNRAGCAANKDMRPVIGFLVANADIIIPTTWELMTVAQLDDAITQDDLAESILSANSAVDNELLWDATPEEVIELAIGAGAEYMDLVGEHKEKVTRVDMSKGAFDKAKYVLDHKDDTQEVQAFSASFGAYVDLTLRRAEMHGVSRRDAVLQISRVFMFNIALTKMLKNDDMPVAVLAEVN
jgi:hypothetical protein